MFNLVYASTAVQPFSSEELRELLQHARTKNAALGITGLLLYKHGAFMQALEGEEASVRSLYAVICKDTRHHHLSTLLAAPVRDRYFPDWSMGFELLADQDLGEIPSFNPDPILPAFAKELPWKSSIALRLLSGFKRRD